MSSQNNDNQQQSTNPVDTMPSILLTDVTDVMKSIIECLEENIEGTDALYSRVVVSRMRGKQELRSLLSAMTKNLETVLSDVIILLALSIVIVSPEIFSLIIVCSSLFPSPIRVIVKS